MTVEKVVSLPDPASSLCAYMDDLVEGLRKLVPAALRDFDEISIHQARVATRRLKAAIDLLESVLSDDHRKPFAKAGRQLRRRLGPMRDLDVMIGHLRTIQRRAAHREAAAWLEHRLTQAREAAREDSKSDDAPSQVLARMGTWWGLREEVLEAGDQARFLVAMALHLQLDAFAEQADLLAKKETLVKQDPHQVRIAGKALRYTLEMAKCEGYAVPGGVAKAFKKMQDALGSWHDFVVLTERAMAESLASLLAHHDMAMQRKLLDLSRFTLESARRELDRFSALWAQEGPALLPTIHAAVPLAKPMPVIVTEAAAPPAPVAEEAAIDEITVEEPPITESKTDPDPLDSTEPKDQEVAPATDPEAA